MIGIYCYEDTLNDNEIVYVGKDSNIAINRRHKDHFAKGNYDAQQINRVLQNNPDRYRYRILKQWKKEEYNPNLANALEILYIRRYNPLFNFTKGGEGILGHRHSPETREKISRNHADFSGKNHPQYGTHLSEETKKKISKAHRGKKLTKEHRQKIRESHRDNHGENNPMWKDFSRIVLGGFDENGNRRYLIVWQGKRIKSSISLSKLIKWWTEKYPYEILQLKVEKHAKSR